MSKEEEQLDYEDALVQLHSVCQQYGCRTVLIDFRDSFPEMFEEMVAQAIRLKPAKQVPALFKPDACSG